MADNRAKELFRTIIRDGDLWGDVIDAMSKVLFPKSILPSIGVSMHSRLVLWALANFDRVLTLLPRYHAKSTIVTFAYVMYIILTRKRKFILIISSTGSQAIKFLGRIRFYLTSRKVKHYYGDLKAAGSIVDTENESFDYVETDGGKGRSKVWNYKELSIEPWGIKIMCTSIAAANRGLLSMDDRPDLIILDDIENRKNTNTPELREKLSDTIVEEIFPGGKVDCQIIVNGTICHFDSFLLKLRKAGNWFFIPAMRSTDKADNIKELNKLLPKGFKYQFDPKDEFFTEDTVGLDGKYYRKGDKTPEVALWQGLYSYQYFCRKYNEYAALGKLSSFWQEYYNIPKSAQAKIFTEFQYLEGIKFTKLMEENVLESTNSFLFNNGKHVINVFSFLGGDLAVSEREGADWRTLFTVFTDSFYNVYVLPPYFSKEPNPFNIGKIVLRDNMYYNYNSATFDGQHFQKWFASIINHLQDTDPEFINSRLTKIHQSSRSEKKEVVITGILSPFFTGKRIYFLGTEKDFEMTVKELENLGYYGSDDFADGLTFACSNLRYPDLINFENVMPIKASVNQEWYEEHGIPEEEVWKYA